jgi:hypothetical protein
MNVDINDANIEDIGAWFFKGNHLRETGRSRDAIFCYQKDSGSEYYDYK